MYKMTLGKTEGHVQLHVYLCVKQNEIDRRSKRPFWYLENLNYTKNRPKHF